ncbi:peptidoglycan-binding domain-containing protein (plasmid) [Rhizobium leguminosarum bv. viciae]|nr:peptidoglycan-binding domain-containing protein [Rhizobium leguminosarum bv. viciae]
MAAKELSGVGGVAHFPDAKEPSALADGFREGCKTFIAAMTVGGIHVTVNSTRRPTERAYLMHYSWRIHKRTLNPQNVPPKTGVDIDWVHKAPSGKIDLAASRRAASAMVAAYGIAFQPSLTSRHIEGQAIDMSLHWTGDVTIKNKANKDVSIAGAPRDGFNPALRKVGKSYGVVKHPSDPPHWSTDGR